MAEHGSWTRREVLEALSLLGVGTSVLARVPAARAEEAGVTADKLAATEWIPGLSLTDADRALMTEDMTNTLAQYAALRGVGLDNGVPPALVFRPVPSRAVSSGSERAPEAASVAAVKRPSTDAQLAFLSLRELGELVRTRQVTAMQLTELYLARLEKHDPVLRCVITLTADLAREAAARADQEIANGRYRGPLHGIPWGAKDLIAVSGYRTTWGATPFKDQVREGTATVVRKLEDAGAVLVAKLAVGELAWGDVWFDATTKNPWKTDEGSSGSSAGSASATSAGLVGFALGTETWGSIVSPCTVCGVSGLRPTFGRVSRAGVMALSWSMDKVGPIARRIADCAAIFDAIRGADAGDPSSVDGPFTWPPDRDARSLRVGFVPKLFEVDRAASVTAEEKDLEREKKRAREWQANDDRTLKELRDLGFTLVPIELPEDLPIDALQIILTAEAATAFDELTRGGRDDLLVRQARDAWPNVFRQGQFIPAVEYIRANRIRSLVMRRMDELFSQIDVFVAPSWEGNHLLLTNLTGHPSAVVPNGFRTDGTPTSITFTGRLMGETDLVAVARVYQEETKYHLQHPRFA